MLLPIESWLEAINEVREVEAVEPLATADLCTCAIDSYCLTHDLMHEEV